MKSRSMATINKYIAKMSFREVRDVSEHLKILGYTNNIHLSAFCTNYGGPAAFSIIADTLQWLANRLEPGMILSGGASNESERVVLIKSASEFFITKAGIKLNPRKLYSSSFCSAKELIKITTLLLNAPQDLDMREEEEITSFDEIDLSGKIDELRRARELSSEITNRGASLYDLLTKELANKETRSYQANRPMELSSIEKTLKNSISALQNKLQTAKNYLEVSRSEKNNINSKLQRKTAELERSRQRLQALQKVRPAYLEEFERLEGDLKTLYSQYIVRIRCVDALKAQISARTRTPPPTTPPIPRSDAGETSMIFLAEGLIDSDMDDDDEEEDELKEEVKVPKEEVQVNPTRTSTRLRVRTGIAGGRGRFVGNMGANVESTENLDSSLGSDDETGSEIDLGEHGFDDELRSDDEDDDDESFKKLTREPPKQVHHHIHSDEDF